jgi:hypothetical protein
VPAVRVRRPQLALLWRTLRCTTINTALVKHRVCVCGDACAVMRVRVR